MRTKFQLAQPHLTDFRTVCWTTAVSRLLDCFCVATLFACLQCLCAVGWLAYIDAPKCVCVNWLPKYLLTALTAT